MAKTPKVKKREVSVHSRAARRNASPPPKTSTVKAPVQETEYKPWLHSAQDAGISKKKKSKPLTHQQRMRQQRAMEKAEETSEKLEKKVADSKKRSRKIQSRRIDWEELNETLEGKKKAEEDAKLKKEKSAASKSTEDVVLPDSEQPLPLRSTEMAGVEEELPEQVEQQTHDAAENPEEDEVL